MRDTIHNSRISVLLCVCASAFIFGCSDDVESRIGEEGSPDGESPDGVVDPGRYSINPADGEPDQTRGPGEPGNIDVEKFATSCSSSSQCVLVQTDVCKTGIICSEDDDVVNEKFASEIRELRDKYYSIECPGLLDEQVAATLGCNHFPACVDGECANKLPHFSGDVSAPFGYPSQPRFVTRETATSAESFGNECEIGADCRVVRRNDCLTCPDRETASLEHWTALEKSEAEQYLREIGEEICEEYTTLDEDACAPRRDLQAICVQGRCDVREN